MGTWAGVFGFLDLSLSGKTIRFGKALPSTEAAEKTNWPGTYAGSVEYTGLVKGNPVLFLSNQASNA